MSSPINCSSRLLKILLLAQKNEDLSDFHNEVIFEVDQLRKEISFLHDQIKILKCDQNNNVRPNKIVA